MALYGHEISETINVYEAGLGRYAKLDKGADFVGRDALVAKAALRQLAIAKLEPTPENYARAYAEQLGQPLPPPQPPGLQGPELAALIERIARGLERGGRTWTTGRKKDSLHRVLASSRSDVQRLQQRLKQLVASWDSDSADDAVDTGFLARTRATWVSALHHCK